jgi:hypothetical protein
MVAPGCTARSKQVATIWANGKLESFIIIHNRLTRNEEVRYCLFGSQLMMALRAIEN